MEEQIRKLAFEGQWASLIQLLREHPSFINVSASPKHYTPLHQAAWHGASLAVIGQLIKLGADRGLTTFKGQTPADVAKEKHPRRIDLEYVLAPELRTFAQLMRKVAATPLLFGDYDGNRIICDRMIASFGVELCPKSSDSIKARMGVVFEAVTGVSMSSRSGTKVIIDHGLGDAYPMEGDVDFWNNRFIPSLLIESAKMSSILIETGCATISDLFHPAPSQWGLRGDLFLWLEMRQSLCQVELPRSAQSLGVCISSAFTALTGHGVDERESFSVPRFARGGMSGGYVSCDFWKTELIPMMQQRLRWIEELSGELN